MLVLASQYFWHKLIYNHGQDQDCILHLEKYVSAILYLLQNFLQKDFVTYFMKMMNFVVIYR